jgi:hypothetical protein
LYGLQQLGSNRQSLLPAPRHHSSNFLYFRTLTLSSSQDYLIIFHHSSSQPFAIKMSQQQAPHETLQQSRYHGSTQQQSARASQAGSHDETSHESSAQSSQQAAQSQTQSIQQNNRRAVHMIVYDSRLFKAHWSYFIFQENSETTGTVVHVVGDVRNGFHHQIKRNYNHALSTTRHRVINIGHVHSSHFSDVIGDGSPHTDMVAHNSFEQALLSVPAPGPSLNPATGTVRFLSRARLLTH